MGSSPRGYTNPTTKTETAIENLGQLIVEWQNANGRFYPPDMCAGCKEPLKRGDPKMDFAKATVHVGERAMTKVSAETLRQFADSLDHQGRKIVDEVMPDFAAAMKDGAEIDIIRYVAILKPLDRLGILTETFRNPCLQAYQSEWIGDAAKGLSLK